MLVSFYRPQGKRYKILCEAKAFPSDQYAFETQVKFHGLNPADTVIEVSPREGEYHLRPEDSIATIKKHGESVALDLCGGIKF